MKSRKWLFPVFLLLYHSAFAFIAWQYNLANPSDAYKYWHFEGNWIDFFSIGTDVIKFINYPFVKVLNLPFWMGFSMYSLIGYYAILELYRFAQSYVNPQHDTVKYGLMGVFLLPNLHFWTAIIGKEPLVFLAITWIIIKQTEKQYINFKYFVGWLLLILIRPHVALFLLLAIGITLLIKDSQLTRKKIGIAIGLATCSLGLYLMTMHLLNRNPFDLAYILERNNASLVAFKRANSYVPMIDYNWIERIFALNFRPLFFDAHSFFSLVLSVENVLTLLLMFLALMSYIVRFKTIKLDTFARISLLFFVVSSLFFIQRYSCLGIFVRTKIMYAPFVLILAIKILNGLYREKGHGK